MASSTAPEVIPIKIEVELSQLDAMKAKLRETEASVKALQATANAGLFKDNPLAAAKAELRGLTSEVKALERAQKDANAAGLAAYKFQKANAAAADKEAAAGLRALFGTSIGELAAGKLADAFGKGKEETAEIKGLLMSGGEAIASGAKYALAAATAIAAAGAGLVVAGVKFGVESTAQRQKNTAILDRLTQGQGEIAESVSKQLAGETGVGEDKAMERVKALIQAKFDRADTELVFKASAEIGEVRGEGKAEAFLSILEKVQLEGKVTEKALKGLAGAGVEKSALLEQLKQTGETTEQVEARIKAGGVAAKDFARAAATAVQKDIGGVAGKGLDAMLNRLKIGFGDLFDDFDLGPLDALGSSLSAALSGKDGEALKASITAAGNSVLGLAKNVTAADIKGLFTSAASAASTLAAGITEAAGAAGKLWNFAKQVSGSGSHMEAGSSGDATGDAIEQEIAAGNRRAFIREQEAAKAKAAADKIKEAQAGGVVAGNALADGMATGIDAGAAKVNAASAAMVKGAITSANAQAQIKSPSRVMAESGKNFDEGLEQGIERNAGKPARAASDVMRRTTGAASGGTAPGGASGGSPGGGITIAITQNLPAGTPQETRDAARRGAQEGISYALLLPFFRQYERDKQETRTPMVPA